MAKGKGMKAIIETINYKRKRKARSTSIKYLSTLNDDEIAKILDEATKYAELKKSAKEKASEYIEKREQ